VLWIGVHCDVDLWQSLAGDDQQPHMTVARSRRSVDMTDTVETLAGHHGPEWIATELVLFESLPGPMYVPLDSFPLGGPPVS
jgi:2'-5' RNA ligase